ncbi:MAG: 3-phosphoshikimate 1-carboxyvinyltransferase [Lachnospiraceae bacterium]|nr:3-phosphoshikimate 1-carboxyvinyltransferase [Lachnospiraceae bacterium]
MKKVNSLKGKIKVPGDKSISHRGIMFGSISEGITELDGFLNGADCISTMNCFKHMGINISHENEHVIIHGKGLHGLNAPLETLDVGNSGTTTRLISGILSGQTFSSTLNGDASIQARPMKRIMTPLRLMGADIVSEKNNDCAPLLISPVKQGLKGIHYDSPVASAQVKSCILLAGLYADDKTTVTEPVLSRNHTELMLRGFGADVTSKGTTATIAPNPSLSGQKIFVPGDISSAAYFIVAGAICQHSDLLIENVNTNPTRAGIISVALSMGASLELLNKRNVSGEEVCDLHVKTSDLHGCEIKGDIIPTLIDEIPIICVMAACAKGDTIISDASELKVKESNRIDTVIENLKAMGVSCEAKEDGMIIHGQSNEKGHDFFYGAQIKTYMDHRIAMSFAIASLCATGETTLDHPECVDISYPEFYKTLTSISNK